jgi:hypothetical protein
MNVVLVVGLVSLQATVTVTETKRMLLAYVEVHVLLTLMATEYVMMLRF